MARAFQTLAATFLAAASSASPALGGESRVPIVQLAFHDYFVTMSSSVDSPRFTVRNLDGDLLASAVTLEELVAREPEVGRLLESAIASQREGSFIWAGRYPDHPEGTSELRE